MNENIDLTKILEGCPEGTEFYHLIFGKVYFTSIELNCPNYPIRFTMSNDNVSGVTRAGLTNVYYNGECTLFPSKDQRDWSKFVRFWDKPKVDKFDPKTLQPFDKVLVRIGTNYNSGEWHIDYFEYFDEKNKMTFNLSSFPSNWVIPYNDEIKYLVNTTDDCPEYYKWWEE